MKFQNDEYTLKIEDLGHKKQIENIRELILKASTPFSIDLDVTQKEEVKELFEKSSIVPMLTFILGHTEYEKFDSIDEKNALNDLHLQIKAFNNRNNT